MSVLSIIATLACANVVRKEGGVGGHTTDGGRVVSKNGTEEISRSASLLSVNSAATRPLPQRWKVVAAENPTSRNSTNSGEAGTTRLHDLTLVKI